MGEYASQSITHAAVAAGVAETLLRLWGVRDPAIRLGFRLLPLAYPLTVLPAFMLLAPARGSATFRDGWALFAVRRWTALEPPGLPVGEAIFALLAALGMGLFLRDALRLVRRREAARAAGAPGRAEGEEALAEELAVLAERLGVPPPGLRVVDTATPVLLVAGIRRPTLIVSRGALGRLDARERRVALAHELAHVARRDPLLGWALMACRLLGCFNPMVQLLARAAVREVEWRADDAAAVATGDPAALASGLAKLAGAEAGGGPPASAPPGPYRPRGRLGARAWEETIRGRCRRLAEPAARATPFAGLRLLLTGAALGLLLFFVV